MKLFLISYLFGNTNLDDKITKWLRIRANEITILPQQQPSGPALTEPLEWMFSMIFPPVLTPLPGQPVMRVIIPGLQTGSAALKHLQFVSNFSFEANHCAEQNLSRHNDSERLVAIMLKILNFKKKGKESKFLLLEQQGPASSLPLTSHLHLLNKPGKEVDSVPERYWEEECERKSAFLFWIVIVARANALENQRSRHNITGGHLLLKVGGRAMSPEMQTLTCRNRSQRAQWTGTFPQRTRGNYQGHTFVKDLCL